jgi:hypothetical protein
MESGELWNAGAIVLQRVCHSNRHRPLFCRIQAKNPDFPRCSACFQLRERSRKQEWIRMLREKSSGTVLRLMSSISNVASAFASSLKRV